MNCPPLDSEPQSFNKYLQSLDVSEYKVVDIYSLERWAIDMYSDKIAGFILLYPMDNKIDHYYSKFEIITENSDINFIQQRSVNACGQTSILNFLMNHMSITEIKANSNLIMFYDAKNNTNTENFDKMLVSSTISASKNQEANLETKNLDELKDEAAEIPDQCLVHHFVCVMEKTGKLIELDGRKQGPVKIAEILNKSDFYDKSLDHMNNIVSMSDDKTGFVVLGIVKN